MTKSGSDRGTGVTSITGTGSASRRGVITGRRVTTEGYRSGPVSTGAFLEALCLQSLFT